MFYEVSFDATPTWRCIDLLCQMESLLLDSPMQLLGENLARRVAGEPHEQRASRDRRQVRGVRVARDREVHPPRRPPSVASRESQDSPAALRVHCGDLLPPPADGLVVLVEALVSGHAFPGLVLELGLAAPMCSRLKPSEPGERPSGVRQSGPKF